MTRKRSLRVFVLAGTVAAAGLMLAGTAAAQYAGGLTVSSTSLEPGGEVTVSGGGYGDGAAIRIMFASEPEQIGTAQANAQGSFTETVTIPSDAHPGTHTISAVGDGADGGSHVLSATVTVMGAGAPLALTGQNLALMSLAAAGLIGVGLALRFGLGRERRVQEG